MQMKKQGYKDKLDESMAKRSKGKKKQPMSDRRKESEGMEKGMGKKAYCAVKSMDKGSKKKS